MTYRQKGLKWCFSRPEKCEYWVKHPQESATQPAHLDLYSSPNYHLRQPAKWVKNCHIAKLSYGTKNTECGGRFRRWGQVGHAKLRCPWNRGNKELLASGPCRMLLWALPGPEGTRATAPSPRVVRSNKGVEEWKHKQGTGKISKSKQDDR